MFLDVWRGLGGDYDYYGPWSVLLLEVSSAPLTAGSSDLWAICRDDYGIMPGRLKGRLAGRETQVADDKSERME